MMILWFPVILKLLIMVLLLTMSVILIDSILFEKMNRKEFSFFFCIASLLVALGVMVIYYFEPVNPVPVYKVALF